MKLSMKGVVIGFMAGILMTGTVAFAGGAQIEAYIKKISFMVDGVEKTPAEGQVFVHDNLTYVPIRFAAELLGKPIKWDDKTNTIVIGTLGDKEVVATYKDGSQLLLKEYNTYLAIIVFFNPSYTKYAADPAYKKYMLNQYSGFTQLAKSASSTDRSDAKNKAVVEFDKIKKDNTDLNKKLTDLKLTENDVFQYLQLYFTATNAIGSTITDDQIKADFDKSILADKDAYTYATVSHILISLKDSAGKDLRTKDEALLRAQEVEAKLIAGGDFAALAKEYSDDPGSKDIGGKYENQQVNSWVAPFKKAVLELDLNKISDPVESDFGYHIIKVESRTVKTIDDVKADIRNKLVGTQLNNYITNTLPNLITFSNLPK